MAEEQKDWYILWSPYGFPNNTEVSKKIEDCVKSLSHGAIVWYPVTEHGSDSKIQPIYQDYMFVQFKWDPRVETALKEIVPQAEFLRDQWTRLPSVVSSEDVSNAIGAVSRFAKSIKRQISVGDLVRIAKKNFFGQVGRVKSISKKGKVSVGLTVFGRYVPVIVNLSDIQRI